MKSGRCCADSSGVSKRDGQESVSLDSDSSSTSRLLASRLKGAQVAEIGVGLVGYKFMGRAHSNAYRQVAHFFDVDPTAANGGHLRP